MHETPEPIHAGWLAGHDYEQTADSAAARNSDNPDSQDSEDVTPWRDRLAELLTGRFEDTDPLEAPL